MCLLESGWSWNARMDQISASTANLIVNILKTAVLEDWNFMLDLVLEQIQCIVSTPHHIDQFGNHAQGVALSLPESLKRWKRLALTAMAMSEFYKLESKVDAEEHGGIAQKNYMPWIDSRFTIQTSSFGKFGNSNESNFNLLYTSFQEYGIQPVGLSQL